MPKQSEEKKALGHTWTWEADPADLQGHPAGWYSEETPPQYGGKGDSPRLLSQHALDVLAAAGQTENEAAAAAGGPASEEPGADIVQESATPAGPRTVQDPNTGQWFQEIPPEFEGDPPTYRRIPGPAPEKPQERPTLESLIVAAIQKGDWEGAVQLDDFARRPSQSQRLDQAIRYAQSPADYLSVVGMMRGEIPIPSEGFPGEPSYRVGPRSQVYDALGVPPTQAPQQVAQLTPQGQPSILGSNGQNALPPAGMPSFLPPEQYDEFGRLINQPDPNDYPGSPYVISQEEFDRRQRERKADTSQGVAQTQTVEPPREYDEFGNPSNYDFQGNYIGEGTQATPLQQAVARQTPQAEYPSFLQQQAQQPQEVRQVSPSGYPSFLEQAYGQNVIQGRAQDRPSLSYPALAAAAGVPLPRFRSAQTRLYQNPMEKQLFEAALMAQGVDVPTYLQQEEFGTTSGGRRRRRVETVSR